MSENKMSRRVALTSAGAAALALATAKGATAAGGQDKLGAAYHDSVKEAVTNTVAKSNKEDAEKALGWLAAIGWIAVYGTGEDSKDLAVAFAAESCFDHYGDELDASEIARHAANGSRKASSIWR